jgi:hypothetical protein
VARSTSVLGAMVYLLLEDAKRWGRNLGRKGRLGKLGLTGKARRDLVKRASRMIKIQRGQVVAPKAQLLLHAWKKVHVPFTILLTAIGAVHIWDAWARAW